MDDYTDKWEMYGLKTDPFFTEPLSLYGDVDIKLGFVGREEEARRLKNLIGSSGSSRIIVTGDVGVGKTTLVNYVRANAPEKRFFTPIKEIQTRPEWTGSDFILNTLSAIHNTIKVRSDLDPKQLSPDIWKKLELLVDIVEQKDKNYSIDLLGVGGGYGTTTSISLPQQNINGLHLFFEQLVRELQSKLHFRELILSYNNLEVIDHQDLIRIFNSIRDFIQTKDVKFIFIGGHAVLNSINKIPRVQSIMSETPVVLMNLTIKEIKALLQKRIDLLTIPGLNSTTPFKDDVVATLYGLYDGNLRFILNSLSIAFRDLVKDTPIVLSASDIKKILPEIARKRWIDKLTKTEYEVLMYVLEKGEVTNKRIANDLKKQKQNISPMTKKLVELGVIHSRTEGTEKFFQVHHSVKWLLLKQEKQPTEKITTVKVSNEIQKILDSSY